ncbi:MAG: hypothetical protein ACREBT_01655 [Thermoplasmata archaeon]
MSGLSAQDLVNLTEVLAILAGIGILWAVYYHSDTAELPGTVAVPDPSQVDDTMPDTRGRTL